MAVTGSDGLHEFDNLLFHQAAEQHEGSVLQLLLACGALVAVLQKVSHGAATVGLAAQYVQEHPVIYAEARCERFGLGVNQAFIRVLVEGYIAVLGRFPLLEFFAGLAALRLEFQVLDHVFGSLCHHVAHVVKALAAGASCNLVEVSCGEDCRLVAAVLAELREEYCADGDVHAYAERVGAADDFQQAFLGELFAEDAVLGQ